MGATGISKELTFHVPNVVNGQYVATVSGDKIVILPVAPLNGATNYAVVLTNGIVNSAGNPITPDLGTELTTSDTSLFDAQGNPKFNLDVESATRLEGVRLATIPVINATLAYDSKITREDIVTAWSFKTQSIGNNFSNVKAANKSGALQVVNSGMNTSHVKGYGKADIWVGAMASLPYYLGTPSQTKPTAPLTDYYVDASGSAIFSGMPKEQSTKVIPVLMTKPNATSKAVLAGATAPWPVVIFQHGITQNRTNVLAIADALADAGYAAVAIDLPLHGLDNNTTSLMTSYERTFDVDYVDNATGAPGPDGNIDASGTHYINLVSLLTARDNIRQSASDLLALRNALGAAGVGIDDLDSSRVAFVAHSLGTIASFGFLSTTKVESVTFAMPGGGIAELLNNSPRFGPVIEAGLASKGIMKGTSSYVSFMLATQTVLDDADPINYAMLVGATQNIFAIEVIGNGTEGTSDQIIPNSVATAPLAGTEPLLTYMQTVNLTATTAVKPNQAARFLEGDHNSILDPTASMAATVEMQTQVANFVASKGSAVVVTDGTLLRNP